MMLARNCYCYQMSLGKPLALWAGLHFSTGNGVVTWLHGYIVTAKQGSSCFLRPGHIVTMSPIEGPGGECYLG